MNGLYGTWVGPANDPSQAGPREVATCDRGTAAVLSRRVRDAVPSPCPTLVKATAGTGSDDRAPEAQECRTRDLRAGLKRARLVTHRGVGGSPAGGVLDATAIR